MTIWLLLKAVWGGCAQAISLPALVPAKRILFPVIIVDEVKLLEVLLSRMRELPLLFKFYFIIACYLHVCTRVNIYMCGGQRLTLDILYLVDKPPIAPGANPFGYSGWKKSHRDFPAASSPCCNCRHSYCAWVWLRTGNLSSSPQACIANALLIKASLRSF